MKNRILIPIVTLFILSSLSLFSETPGEGAAAIRDLIKEKSYDVLFPTRYSEWYKTEEEGMARSEAIVRLSGMFEKRHDIFVSIYDQLAAADFTISEKENPQPGETGKVATATIQIGEREIPFKLYEMKNGKWGFHL